MPNPSLYYIKTTGDLDEQPLGSTRVVEVLRSITFEIYKGEELAVKFNAIRGTNEEIVTLTYHFLEMVESANKWIQHEAVDAAEAGEEL